MKRRLTLHLLAIIGVACVPLGLCCAVVFVPGFGLPRGTEYHVRARFKELPPTDQLLEQWLLKQPGITDGFSSRKGNSIDLFWVNVDTHPLNPVTPNIRAEFERFGYKGLQEYKAEKGYVDK
jgi:hypothetical protein